MEDLTAVRGWLFLGAVAVVVQESLTVYPAGAVGSHLFWGAVSLFLLYRVYRGGRVACMLFLALAVVGVTLFVWQFGSDVRASLLTLAFGAQAAAVLAPPVRRWTSRPQPQSAAVVDAA